MRRILLHEYRSSSDAMLGWIQYNHWYKAERIRQGLSWISIPDFKKQKGSHLAGVFQSKNMGT